MKKRLPEGITLLVMYSIATSVSALSIPYIYKSIIDNVATGGTSTIDSIIKLLVFLALSMVALMIFYRIGDFFMIRYINDIQKELSNYVLEKLEKHSYAFFANSFSGGLVAKSSRFVDAFDMLFSQFVWNIWLDVLRLCGAIAILWYQSWVLGLIFFIWFVTFLFIAKKLISLQVPKNLKQSEYDSINTSRFSDIISNIFTVKTFATEERELSEYKDITENEAKVRRVAWMQEGFWNPMIQGAYVNIFEVIIMSIAIFLWYRGMITPGTIVLLQIYVITTFEIVWGISKHAIRISSALANADEMVQILDKDLDVKDSKNPMPLDVISGKIAFNNVSFKYEKGNNVFAGLNVSIKPKEKVALVGKSGSGKSTFLKLLMRFSDVDNGTITIDGQDISKVKQSDLRASISYVPQDPILFHRTLKENIAYAKPNATMDEIIDIAKKAHANDFIQNLPDKYDSLVGERGVKLSGGERQRVAIARAMMKETKIIVLDEATSALDSESELKIQEAFKELMEGKTTVVIAHRLSTIRNMDRIIVFDNGKIVETGSHSELIKNKKGIYKKLWDSQVGGFIVE